MFEYIHIKFGASVEASVTNDPRETRDHRFVEKTRRGNGDADVSRASK